MGIRQNRMAADLEIGVTRLNRILNGWLQASSEERTRIDAYLRTAKGKQRAAR